MKLMEMKDVFKQHEDKIKAAHKLVLKESIDKDTTLSADIAFIYQTDDNRFYKSTTFIYSEYLEKHNTFTTKEETFNNEISVDEFLDHLNQFKHEDESVATQAKRKRGRPRTRTPK